MHSGKDPWLVFGADRDEAQACIVCIAHAGAGAARFHTWTKRLPRSIQIAAVRAPGRESRRSEPPIDDLFALAREVGDAVVRAELNAPVALFGHCSGAIVAFEVARHLRSTGHPAPACLVVSSQSAPHLLPAEDFGGFDLTAVLRELGGTPEEVLKSPDFLEMIGPAVEADFRMLAGYRFHSDAPLELPIFAVMASGDTDLGVNDISGWARHTDGGFHLLHVTGDHVFSGDGWAGLADAVSEIVCRELNSGPCRKAL